MSLPIKKITDTSKVQSLRYMRCLHDKLTIKHRISHKIFLMARAYNGGKDIKIFNEFKKSHGDCTIHRGSGNSRILKVVFRYKQTKFTILNDLEGVTKDYYGKTQLVGFLYILRNNNLIVSAPSIWDYRTIIEYCKSIIEETECGCNHWVKTK